MKCLIQVTTKTKSELKLKRLIKRATLHALNHLPASTLTRKLKGRKPPYHLDIALVSKKSMQRLNFEYRKKQKTTDVLSFSLLDLPRVAPSPTLIGQMVLCCPVIQSQARQWGVEPEEELQRMIIHGVLHLFGYDHEGSKKEAKAMFRLQEKLLSQLVGKITRQDFY